jgi:hypothetical protein
VGEEYKDVKLTVETVSEEGATNAEVMASGAIRPSVVTQGEPTGTNMIRSVPGVISDTLES